MQWIDNFDLLLFDFDGLLVNTEELHYAAYQIMCKNRGLTLPWSFAQFCAVAHFQAPGKELREAIYKELPALKAQEPNWDVLYDEKKKAYLELLKGDELQLMPGVETLLLALEKKGIKRAVATNATAEQIKHIQEKLPVLRTIPVWVTRELYENPKPAPDAYAMALKLLYKPGDRVVGFEDTDRGLNALLAAKVKAVLICSEDMPSAKTVDSSARHFISFESIENLD